MKIKKLALSGVVFTALTFGSFGIANAQTTSSSTPPTATSATQKAKPARSHNSGFAAHAPAVAKALNMTVDELNTALNSGKTIAALATEKGVNIQTIINTYVAEEQAEHPEMAAADVQKRVTDRVNGVNAPEGRNSDGKVGPAGQGGRRGGGPRGNRSAPDTTTNPSTGIQ
jgi:hypothetical protein